MLYDIFFNTCVLIAFINITHLILKEKYMILKPSAGKNIVIGMGCGLLGSILLLGTVRLSPDIIIDLRNIAILLAACFGGIVPSMISAIIIGAFRVFYYGVSEASIVALLSALLNGIGFGFIVKMDLTIRNKWIASIAYSLILTFISLSYLMHGSEMLMKVLAVYCVVFVAASYFVYIYTDYIRESALVFNRLKEESTKDFLTELNNTRQFDISFNAYSQMALRKEEHLSLLFLDIDHFKKVNDTYGHLNGDLVLKELARILLDSCRVFDVVSRNGGEEFSCLLLDCPASNAVQIAERIRRKVEEHHFSITGQKDLKITVSIGVASYPEFTPDIDDLIENADKALYKAKRAGRNRVVLQEGA